MRIIGVRGMCVIAGALLIAGCGTEGAAQADVKYSSANDTSHYAYKLGKPNFEIGLPHVFDATIKLADGRNVGLYIHKGTGTFEQHYSPTKKAWSKPHLIYATKTDPCQGVTLKAHGDTVAAIFDFNRFCFDGEPPNESLAAVAVGSLQKWDVHLKRHIDGYSKLTFKAAGKTVEFDYQKAPAIWHAGNGFN